MPLSLKLPWPLFGAARRHLRESAPETLELSGPRVTLRPLRIDDADGLFLCASDPRVTEFLPWHPATEVSSVRSFLADQVARRQRGESLGLAVVREGKLVGSVDLMGLHVVKKTGIAEIGYLLNRSYWGQGLTTEAATLARDYGFAAFALKTLVGFADENNEGSRRVLIKLGMFLSGDEIRVVKGQERRYVRYELSRERWERGR
jgi:ribosomal-protein-alanine N-acetyltransferase